MSCNAVDLQNVFLWLVLVAGGLGGAIGALLTALLRRMKSRYGRRRGLGFGDRPRPAGSGLVIKLSLFLSAGALAALGAIIFIDLPEVEWNQFLLRFFLFAVLGWSFLYIAFRWLVIPLVLLSLLYVVLVSGVVRQWDCCQSGGQLLRVKVIAQQTTDSGEMSEIELDGPGDGPVDFRKIEGDALKVVLSTIRFKPWAFYPRCAFLFRVHSILGIGREPLKEQPAAGSEGMGFPLKVLLELGVVSVEQLEIVQPELQVLRSYLLISEEDVPIFRSQR